VPLFDAVGDTIARVGWRYSGYMFSSRGGTLCVLWHFRNVRRDASQVEEFLHVDLLLWAAVPACLRRACHFRLPLVYLRIRTGHRYLLGQCVPLYAANSWTITVLMDGLAPGCALPAATPATRVLTVQTGMPGCGMRATTYLPHAAPKV